MMQSDICIMLVDNGSIKPAATLALRKLAEVLTLQGTNKVHAVSLRHADRISSDELEGKTAQVLYSFMEQQLKAGVSRFILLPLFFSKSGALVSYVPEQVKILEAEYGEIDITIADVIYPLPDGDERLVTILYDFTQKLMMQNYSDQYHIVLVDHGSPSEQVTAVRQHLVSSLQKRLGGISIEQAVMERREGEEYDFNGKLLEGWLKQMAEHGNKTVIVALMFFLPGRHAGPGGDIDNICSRILQKYPDLNIMLTPLVADHAELISILQSRLENILPDYRLIST